MKKEDTAKAKKIGKLLAESPLDDEVKEVLLENIDKMPMNIVDDLIKSLEKEHKVIEDLSEEVKAFLKKQEKDWKDLEKKQQAEADKIVDEEIKKMEKEIAADMPKSK